MLHCCRHMHSTVTVNCAPYNSQTALASSLPSELIRYCAGPTNFGPTAEAGTPWLQLALYTAMAEGPLTVVLVCGQRLWRLPPHLASCTHALVWPWDLESVRAQSSPVLLDAAFLLFSLNEYLSRTAIMVQPMNLPEGTEVGGLTGVQIPLPPLSKGSSLQGESAIDGIVQINVRWKWCLGLCNLDLCLLHQETQQNLQAKVPGLAPHPGL